MDANAGEVWQKTVNDLICKNTNAGHFKVTVRRIYMKWITAALPEVR